MSFEQQTPYPVAQQQRFPWGCLFGGCLAAVLLMVGSLGGIGFVGYRFYHAQIAKYTSDTATELPVVEISEEERQQLDDRLETFGEQVKENRATEPLVLTERDINALISGEDELRGRVFVSIEGEQLSAEVSVPTDIIPGAEGRFFNGSVTLEANLENGVLVVRAQEASVNGQPVPEDIMAGIREENLAGEVYDDPDTAKWLRKFKKLEIRDSQIILTPADPPLEEIESSGNESEGSEPEGSESTEQEPAGVDAAEDGSEDTTDESNSAAESDPPAGQQRESKRREADDDGQPASSAESPPKSKIPADPKT